MSTEYGHIPAWCLHISWLCIYRNGKSIQW